MDGLYTDRGQSWMRTPWWSRRASLSALRELVQAADNVDVYSLDQFSDLRADMSCWRFTQV
jgi:hypothetical protein